MTQEDETNQETGAPDTVSQFKTLTIDYSLYEDYRANSNMSDEEWHETLDALWHIITGFVSLGFNVHPVQQVCEQSGIPEDFLTSDPDNLLCSNDSLKQQFEEITDGSKAPSQERSQS